MKELIITQKELSELVCVHHTTIVNKVRRETLPKPINLLHPDVIDYIKQRSIKTGKDLISQAEKMYNVKLNKVKQKKHEKSNGKFVITEDNVIEATDPDVQIDIDSSTPNIGVELLKKIVDIRNKEADTRAKVIKYKMLRGILINRETTGQILYSYLNILNNWILDVPLQKADTIIALAESKGKESKQEIIQILRKEITKNIRNTKSEVKKMLKKARTDSALNEDDK